MQLKKLYKYLDSQVDFVKKTLGKIIEIKSVNPSFGGPGEFNKASYIINVLSKIGVSKILKFEIKDDRVPEGKRINVVARIEGKDKGRTLWIISHMDTVPEGDIRLWRTDPYKPLIVEDKIYGRGSEDNGQAIVSSLLVAKLLKELNLTPEINLGLAFVSDEEAGSKYGIETLLNNEIFKKNDLILVPDAGSPKGDFIEIAEKSILWLKFTIIGKQAHASMPESAINAHRIGAKLLIFVDEILHSIFSEKDSLFNPPYSTFEPTKKENNVDNINTIPGTDVFYFDCRVVPKYKISNIIGTIGKVCKLFEETYKVKIKINPIAKLEAPPSTDPNSEIVIKLKRAIKLVKNIDARIGGIGGGTFAAHFRKRGFDAAVWSTLDDTAHQPNEYAKISNVINDSKVFSTMLFIFNKAHK